MQRNGSSRVGKGWEGYVDGRNPQETPRGGGRSRAIVAAALAAVLFVVVSVASFIGVARAAGVTGKTVVDPDTTNSWTQYTRPDDQPSTQNVGRIWTDKSVFDDTYTFKNDDNEGLSGQSITKGDSDFIVSLSALSSTSNLKSTTVSTKPLDIVLVLDVSGSMSQSMGTTYTYTEAYPSNHRGTYYVKVDGAWQQVEYFEPGRWDSDPEGWRYRSGGSGWNPQYTYVEPKTSPADNDPDHIQFYSRGHGQNISKIDALQNAADAFVDSVAEMNDGITDPNNQHRISLVKFASGSRDNIGNNKDGDGYNNSQVVSDLAPYTTDNAATLKNTIDRLEPAGSTYANYGMSHAKRVLDGGEGLTGARANAQKVVIFFTDGEPGYSEWSGSVAAEAINYAYDMKQDGTLIYSIGVFQDADPSDTSGNFNKYMNAVSSNYRDAQCAENTSWFPWDEPNYEQTDDFGDLMLGDRTTGAQGEPNPDYYFAATDSEQLDQVFEDITSSITENVGSGSPIVDNSLEGNLAPGNLTFTDQLGSYMQVTGTGVGKDQIQLAYGDEIYTSDSKETNGNVDTYHFTGTVDGNAVYGSANLADLTVTVTRSDDLATGDTITVTLPASLIPLRNYNVDTDTGDMTVSQAYPVRLFYGVSLKAEAKEALNKPSSDEYAAIVASQKSADGKTIDFYSNNFTAGAADGLTTATFEPNAGNKFYYYTQNTTLYVDEGCNTEATQWNIGNYNTLYWKDTYWVQTSEGTGEERSTGVAIQRGTAEWNAMQKEDGWDGAYYIPAGTQRTDRPATLTDGKDSNETKTAANVLNPSWSDTDEVTQALGNNGKLYYEMPGSLEIKKTVDWGNASDETKQNTEKNTFTFEITASVPSDEEGKTEPLSGTYNYYVGDKADGNVTFNEGKATLEVKGGTTVRIDSLPVGTEFTVTEKGVGDNGWTVKDATAQDGVQNDNTTDGIVTGTIESATQVSLTFDNVYRAADVNLSTNTTLSVEKVLKGRDWRDSDEFTFDIDGLGNTAGNGITTPEPADTTITVNSQTEDYKASFGDITFTAPGEYRYNITEDNDTDPINGIDYSAAIYRVVVTVTDDGNGKLVVSKVELQQTQNDEGTMGAGADPVPVEGSTATFTNTYDVNSAPTNIDGTKVYNDTTGGNGIDYGKFTFQLEALGGYETKGGSSVNYTVDATDVPMPADVAEGTTTKQVTNTGHDFTFGTINYDGNDVGKTFEYKVTEIAGDEKGMSYDETEHIVQVEVEEVTTGEGTPEEETHLVATVLPPYDTPAGLKFTNEYDPADAVLEGDTAIHGTKTLVGREMHDGEAFYFKLTAMSDNAKSVLPESQVVQVTKADMQDGSAGFVFGNMTFAKTGEYTFTVDEVASDGQGGYTETADGAGMTYDTNTYTVKVNVADNHDGTLKAEVTYTSDTDGTEAEEAQFTNTYEASMNYGAQGKGGIKVTKQLTNRPMNASEFEFSITGVDSDTVKAEDANKKLAGADTSFSNTAVATGQVNTMDKLQSVTFDETDAGKTYSYIVDETTESGAPQVTYDKTQYRVDIKVVDNGNGTMHTLTTVTKIQNAQGEPANTVIVDKANSDADGYTAPTFGFVNEYNPTPATVGEGADYQIQVTKYVEGADSATDYTFTLKLADSSAGMAGYVKGLGQDGTMTVATSGTIPAGESQTLTFGELTFSKPGTYSFTVQENAPDADAGWEFDTGERTVTVEVTDRNAEGKYDGKLYIAKVDGSPVEITNRYAADPVVVGGEGAEQQITVQKTVKGAASTTDFQFKIEPVDKDDEKWDNVKAVESDFDGQTSITEDFAVGDIKTATFGGIKFSATGEYQFKITEVGAADFNDGVNRNGWTYDEHAAFVTVTVTDNGEGQLVAKLTYDNDGANTDTDKQVEDAAAFTNAYTTTPVELTQDAESGIGVQKKVEGAPNSANFTFSATFNADASAEKAAAADMAAGKAAGIEGLTEGKLSVTIKDDFEAGDTKAADFGTIKLTKPGVYVFDVTEDNAKVEEPNGWTYDKTTHQITVTVTDNGKGQLEATVDGNDPLFTNSYHAHSVTLRGEDQLKVTKEVTGAPALSDFEFTLTLIEGDATAVTGIDEHGITKSTSGLKDKTGDEAKQTVEFGELTFTKAGTYTFQVVENTTTDAAGWTYASGDDNAQTITVTVTDDQVSGQLEATTELDGEETNNPTFTNSYKAGSITTGTDNGINVQKTLTGRDWLEGDSFEFVLEAVDGAPMPEGDGNKVTITDKSDPKTAVFSGITYEAAGDYKYTVTETKGTLGGVTYDEHVTNVTVTIADDDYDGSFEVKSVVYDNSDAATDADQAVDNAAAFTNVYKASGSLDGDADGNLTVTKSYTSNLGDPWTPDDSFGFTLAADTTDEPTKQAVDNGWIALPENAGKADEPGITVTAESKNHQASFGDITFTHAGTFKFTVREVLPEGVSTDSPTKDGITYDTSVKTVTVNVIDNGDGTLTATVADGSDALTFDNTYNVQPVMFRAAYFALQGNKVLDGRNWEQGDTFTFTMTAGRGTNPDGETQMDPGVVEATMPEKTSDTIEPLADGSKVTDNSAQFTFTDERYPGGDVVPDAEDVFTFTQPGTYRYLIAETNPNASNPGSGILGVTYDQTQYRLTVVVEDDGNGNLQVTSSKFSSRPTAGSGEWTDIAGDQGITFTNKYSASEVGVSFNAAKVLTGRDTAMSDNEFMFHMTFAGWMSNDDFDAQSENWKMDGEVAEKAPAAAADKGNIIRGDVIFDIVTFTSDNVGYTYRYAITEVIPDDATNAAYPGVAYGTASAEQKAAAGWTKNGVTYDGSTKYVTAKVTSEQTQDQQNPGTYIEVVRVATGGEAPYNTQTGAFEGDAIFTNTYDAGSTDVDTGTAEAKLTKVLTGKAWDGDSFTFKIEAVSNTAGIEVAQQPMPAQTEVKVNAATGEDAEGNDQATFSFGKISYDTPGTYVYKVTEVAGNNPGITYSKNEATITVSVKDNNAGGYTTGVTVANNVFTNEYASELDFAAAGGIEITKAFENASMRAFSFTVKPADQKSADKLGIDMDGETFTTKAGATVGDDNASHAEIMVIDAATEAKFTQNDADDTYTYTVQEVQGADASVDYDGTVYTVSITTTDDGHGGIKVTTTVTDGAGYTQTYVYDNDENEDPTAVIPFTNTYKATGELGGNGSASIKATKTLTNRPMVDGEFTFNVTNAADPNDAVVATGTNAADGTITFSAIDYSIDQMMEDVDNNLATPSVVDGKNTFTYTYDVTENTANLDDGVAAIDAAGFQITVTVTDNGEGTLGVAVGYPQGSENGLTFRNTYGEGQTGQQTIAIAGAKQLKVESGNNAPDIEGKYTFTLTGEDGAPMPATTEATNDASGNVSFGDITFTMENVFGDTGSQTAAATAEAEGTEDAPAVESAQRTKTFTYTVTETGDVAGVANDAEASKTFTVTVTDNGDGTLSAVADPAQGALFTFTNTYSVDPQTSSPTADGGLTLTKELTGRTMDEGEFQVVMVDADGTQVSQGVNAADGSIALDAITFSTPGDYTYTFYEVDSHKGGVTYDAARYTATAHVEDKGNGTLSVTWEFADANGDPVTDVVVSNSYEARDASIYVGGSKVLDGRALAEDEFSFELRDADGNVLQTVKNAADGGFVFDAMTFDTAGEYQFTVAEALPEDDDPATAGVQKDGVTYDETVYTVDVTVEDNREGYLWVTSLTYNGKAELPVFSNTYVEPAAPAGPSDDGLIQTSDMMPTAVMAAAGIGAVCVAAGVVTRKKRGE